MNRLELLDGFEPVFIKAEKKDQEKQDKNPVNSCGPVYSNNFWLPEDVEVLLEDLRQSSFGG